MIPTIDVAVIGGGIVGVAHAWMAARRQQRVVLLERSPEAQGASVRNFGMIWPVGQPAGDLYSLALRSRDLWLELKSQNVLDADECGSIHPAHRADELAVLHEFCQRQSHRCELLTPAEVISRSPMVNPDGLQGGLWSPTELRVDPRTAVARIAAWLQETQSVECCFETPVSRIEGKVIHGADGRRWAADRIVVCSGSDLRTLYRDVFRDSGLTLCKLQMLQTVPQSSMAAHGPHIASGLTLRHYSSFGDCPSLPELRSRIAHENPDLDRYGIHVMASLGPDGKVILGDSHEYEAEITPFDKAEIDELILKELRKVIHLNDWTIRERWHGIYAKHPDLPVFEREVDAGVHVFTGTGGAGMTMSFGLAERTWAKWMGESG